MSIPKLYNRNIEWDSDLMERLVVPTGANACAHTRARRSWHHRGAEVSFLHFTRQSMPIETLALHKDRRVFDKNILLQMLHNCISIKTERLFHKLLGLLSDVFLFF